MIASSSTSSPPSRRRAQRTTWRATVTSKQAICAGGNPADHLSRPWAGQMFRVEMEVFAGMSTVDSVSAYLDFDPAVLRVGDENGAAATQIIPGNALATVTTNAMNNTTGQINFTATGAPAGGRFNVATIRFRALAPTASGALTWSMTAPRSSDVQRGGASVLSSLQGGTIVVGPAALLAGQATLQDRPAAPAASWSVPMLLTLSQSGDPGPDYVFGMMGDQNGAFTMPGVAAPGDYQVRLKSLHTLRNLLPTTLAGGANALNLETLLEGDAYSDNRVNGRDASLLAAAFGKTQGQPGFDPRADLNEDDAVNAADLTLLQANLGHRGDILLGVQVASSKLSENEELLLFDLRPATNAPVGLRLAPSSAGVAVGQIVTLEVIARRGREAVSAFSMAAPLTLCWRRIRRWCRTPMEAPFVYPDGRYRMCYAGFDGSHFRILSASSQDGLTWQKEKIRLDLGGRQSANQVTDPEIVRLPDGSFRLFYSATMAQRPTRPIMRTYSLRSSLPRQTFPWTAMSFSVPGPRTAWSGSQKGAQG